MHPRFCKDSCFSNRCMDRLVSIVKKNHGSVNRRLIERAFLFSKHAHKDQLRASKKPYFLHPLETAATLAKMGLGSASVAAGLLHDVLEDTDVKESELKKRFGKEVFSLVDGVTKLDLLASESRQSASKNLQSLLFATTKDPRVILIKLADKLHNLYTLKHLPAVDRKRIASEALMIYVPIAHKLGVEAIAVELEGQAFSHAQPETFKRLCKQLKPLRSAKASEINLMIAILKKRLPRASFCKEQKSAYSVFTKMRNTGKMLDEMNDCVILNVLVEGEQDCYSALGVVHGLFPPLANKVKDFIASPKPNLYRVLQTTVFGPKEKPVKVRIATPEMNAINRHGLVACRKISESKMPKELQQSLSRLGFLLSNGGTKGNFIDALKIDFLTRPIYVFTCRGKLVELPKKSTVLDFAFATKKNRALHLLRAKVNGKKVGFSKRLDSGNVVELFFSKKARVKKKWLKYANSLIAKDAIREALKGKKRF